MDEAGRAEGSSFFSQFFSKGRMPCGNPLRKRRRPQRRARRFKPAGSKKGQFDMPRFKPTRTLHGIETQGHMLLALKIPGLQAQSLARGGESLLNVKRTVCFWPCRERSRFQFCQPFFALLFPLGRRLRNLPCICERNKGLMNVCCSRPGRRVGETSQLLWLQKRNRRHFYDGVYPLQMAVEPTKHRHLQVLRILVRARADHESKVAVGMVKLINASHLPVQALDTIEGENGIVIRV